MCQSSRRRYCPEKSRKVAENILLVLLLDQTHRKASAGWMGTRNMQSLLTRTTESLPAKDRGLQWAEMGSRAHFIRAGWPAVSSCHGLNVHWDTDS